MRPMLVGVALLLIAVPASAQAPLVGTTVTLGLTIGMTEFGGAAEPLEARTDDLRAMPYRPTMWGISLEVGSRHSRLRIGAAYGQPGLALRGNPAPTPEAEGDRLLLVADNAFKLASIIATIAPHRVQFPAGPSLWPSVGVLIERWTSPGAAAQTLLGAQLGVQLEVPLSSSIAGALGLDIGFTPGSPFREEVLPEGFKAKSTWRRTLTAGAVVRL